MASNLEQARREALTWAAFGSVTITAGISIGLLFSQSRPAWLGSGLFVIAGAYLVLKAYPFFCSVKRLLRDKQPAPMLLIITGSKRQIDPTYYAELRYLDTPPDSPCDIQVHVGYQPWFDTTTGTLTAKVFGSSEPKGPVVIETQHGYLLPSGPGAVIRRPRRKSVSGRGER